jgi:hypothetical protein
MAVPPEGRSFHCKWMITDIVNKLDKNENDSNASAVGALP